MQPRHKGNTKEPDIYGRVEERVQTFAMRWFLSLLLGLELFTGTRSEGRAKDLFLYGMFDQGNSPVTARKDPAYQGLLPACEMAIEQINNRSDILPGYNLKIPDDMIMGGRAVAVYHLIMKLFHEPTMIMILGPGGAVVDLIAETAPIFNLIQLTFSTYSPALSDRQTYPFLFKTIQTDNVHNPARIALLQHFGWDKVATIQDTDDRFTTIASNLNELLGEANITVQSSGGFGKDVTSQLSQLENLKAVDARIVIALMAPHQCRKLLCWAYNNGMYGSRYLWIFNGALRENWWKPRKSDTLDCTAEEIDQVMEYSISTEPSFFADEGEQGIAGYSSPNDYWEAHVDYARLKYGAPEAKSTVYVPLAFDAVYAAALALNASAAELPAGRGLEDWSYEDSSMRSVFFRNMEKTNFLGVSGPVRFDKTGDRLGRIIIKQIQDGKAVEVGKFHAYEKKIIWSDTTPPKWKGGQPPVDEVRKITREIRVSDGLLYTMVSLAGLGMIFCLLFLAFNFKFREKRVIKMSSPRLNNALILGCIFAYLAIILFGLTENVAESNQAFYMCKARVWIMVVGFTLAFGSMFSKTWRVYALFRHTKVEKKVIKDFHLFAMVGSFLLMDVVFLMLWEVLDPITMQREKFPEEEDPNRNDVLYLPELRRCTSDYLMYWLGIIYASKGILILFGIFLAWETRKVQIPELNDSKQIGLCVYNVMIMSAVGVPIINLLDSQQLDISFAVLSVCIIVCTSTTLALVFVPKIWQGLRHGFEIQRSGKFLTRKGSSGTVTNGCDDHISCKKEIILLKNQINVLNKEIMEIRKRKGSKGDRNGPSLSQAIVISADRLSVNGSTSTSNTKSTAGSTKSLPLKDMNNDIEMQVIKETSA
ncbi:gamma-aminobutyric acid type B receptor subunit 2-like isoform X1 [Branchiostoma floridae]|uniref:Gamma-aminobutyric acid type B receptor subunit 2 n=2 Tax=Branchiostoma floridae TaxID=7739 RepID=A0A9J7MPN6_BRAFL|nr:gamma-aminobutyric acid type B receptor subunit 2-like isoform X1 [Branchiostoma floridae]